MRQVQLVRRGVVFPDLGEVDVVVAPVDSDKDPVIPTAIRLGQALLVFDRGGHLVPNDVFPGRGEGGELLKLGPTSVGGGMAELEGDGLRFDRAGKLEALHPSLPGIDGGDVDFLSIGVKGNLLRRFVRLGSIQGEADLGNGLRLAEVEGNLAAMEGLDDGGAATVSDRDERETSVAARAFRVVDPVGITALQSHGGPKEILGQVRVKRVGRLGTLRDRQDPLFAVDEEESLPGSLAVLLAVAMEDELVLGEIAREVDIEIGVDEALPLGVAADLPGGIDRFPIVNRLRPVEDRGALAEGAVGIAIEDDGQVLRALEILEAEFATILDPALELDDIARLEDGGGRVADRLLVARAAPPGPLRGETVGMIVAVLEVHMVDRGQERGG